MEYSNEEKQFLSLMKRTDFKNLSKNEVLSYASKLNELRPEVAAQVIEQFPELTKIIQSLFLEYKDFLGKIIESDDNSINHFYNTADKEIQQINESRKQFYDFATKIYNDLSKCLENPNLSSEERVELISNEMEIIRICDQKDREMREQEMKLVDSVNKKDSEKRSFNWKLIGSAGTAAVIAIGIGASFLGGNFNIKLPKK